MKRIAILTTGGDAPGINAVIRAAVLTGHSRKIIMLGVREGYQGLIEGQVAPLIDEDVREIIHLGGTILKSSRSADFLTRSGRNKAFKTLTKVKADALIVIGGNGSLNGASQFASEFAIPVLGIPKTIDNDVAGTDYTIGFDTALNNAISAIDMIRISASSHNRVFFVEVMGRDAGHIALHAGIATGSEVILIPETVSRISALKKAIRSHSGKKRSPMIVLVAEGDDAGHAVDIVKKIKKEIPEFNPGISVLGYIQRGGSPSIFDRYLATRMGSEAIGALLSGTASSYMTYTGGKIGVKPFSDLKKGKHPIDQGMIKLARTLGQIV